MTQAVTRLANLASGHAALVDDHGRITTRGPWTLDWWIGGEDRWHAPAREVSVRQALVDDMPVVETRVRVPGGDAVHRAYAAVGDDADDELLFVEIENDSPTPFVVAFAIEGASSIGLTDATVTVDGAPALLLPLAPGRVAASVDGDVFEVVESGCATESIDLWPSDADGSAAAAFLVAVPHRAQIRVAAPITSVASFPTTVPSSTQVAAGWRHHAGQGCRLVVPDAQLTSAIAANRASVLATDSPRALLACVELGLDADFFEIDVDEASVLALGRLAQVDPSMEIDDDVIAPLAALVPIVAKRGDASSRAVVEAAVAIFKAAGERRAARDTAKLATQLPASAKDVSPFVMLEAASPTWSWGSVESSAEFLIAVKRWLVDDRHDGIDLLRALPSDWRGAGVEVHDAPTRFGALSWAVRWHGERPALLWDLSLHPGRAAPTIRIPGLDPTFATTEPRGETLLR